MKKLLLVTVAFLGVMDMTMPTVAWGAAKGSSLNTKGKNRFEALRSNIKSVKEKIRTIQEMVGNSDSYNNIIASIQAQPWYKANSFENIDAQTLLSYSTQADTASGTLKTIIKELKTKKIAEKSSMVNAPEKASEPTVVASPQEKQEVNPLPQLSEPELRQLIQTEVAKMEGGLVSLDKALEAYKAKGKEQSQMKQERRISKAKMPMVDFEKVKEVKGEVKDFLRFSSLKALATFDREKLLRALSDAESTGRNLKAITRTVMDAVSGITQKAQVLDDVGLTKRVVYLNDKFLRHLISKAFPKTETIVSVLQQELGTDEYAVYERKCIAEMKTKGLNYHDEDIIRAIIFKIVEETHHDQKHYIDKLKGGQGGAYRQKLMIRMNVLQSLNQLLAPALWVSTMPQVPASSASKAGNSNTQSLEDLSKRLSALRASGS